MTSGFHVQYCGWRLLPQTMIPVSMAQYYLLLKNWLICYLFNFHMHVHILLHLVMVTCNSTNCCHFVSTWFFLSFYILQMVCMFTSKHIYCLLVLKDVPH